MPRSKSRKAAHPKAKQAKKTRTERDPSLTSSDQAALDELGKKTSEVGPGSGGQSGSAQQLHDIAEAADESVEELAEEEQAYEAGIVDGVENAASRPERPVRARGRRSDLTADPRAENSESEGNGPIEDVDDVA
jgi:hypothetical protein